jgi:hypothetical protein
MNVLDNMVVPDFQVPVIQQQQDQQPAQDDGEIFLLVCSRDLDAAENDLLTSYGKVLRYDDCHINIPLSQLVQGGVNYVIFDVRQKSHRMALTKESGNDRFHVVALINKWEQFDDFVDDANCENCLSSLPPKQAFKKDFNRLLLEKKIRSPSCMKSVFRTFLKVLGGWAKE